MADCCTSQTNQRGTCKGCMLVSTNGQTTSALPTTNKPQLCWPMQAWWKPHTQEPPALVPCHSKHAHGSEKTSICSWFPLESANKCWLVNASADLPPAELKKKRSSELPAKWRLRGEPPPKVIWGTARNVLLRDSVCKCSIYG